MAAPKFDRSKATPLDNNFSIGEQELIDTANQFKEDIYGEDPTQGAPKFDINKATSLTPEVVEDSSVGMAEDIGKQALASIPSGIANMVQTASQLSSALESLMPKGLMDWRTDMEDIVGFDVTNKKIEEATGEFKKSLWQPEGTAGEITREVGQFITGFVGGQKILSAGMKANGLIKAAIAGEGAAFAALDANRDNVFNLLDSVDMSAGNKEFLKSYMASDKDDSALQGRFKNVLENVFTGVVLQKAVDGVLWVKAANNAKQFTKEVERIKPMYEEAVLRYTQDHGYGIEKAQELAKQALKIKDMNLIKGITVEDVKKLSEKEVEVRAKELGIDPEAFRRKESAKVVDAQATQQSVFANPEGTVKKVPSMDSKMFTARKKDRIKAVVKMSNDELREASKEYGLDSKFYDISSPKQQDLLAITQDEALLQGGKGLDRISLQKDLIKKIKAEKVSTKVVDSTNQITQQIDMLLSSPKAPISRSRLLRAVEKGVKQERIAKTAYTEKVAKAVEKERAWSTAVQKDSSKSNVVRRAFNYGILGMRERLQSISPRLSHKINQMEMNISDLRGRSLKAVTPFKQSFGKLSKVDRTKAKELLLAEDMDGFRSFLLARGVAGKSELDKMFMEMGALGKETGEFTYDANFYPKLVTDLEGLKAALGATEMSKITRALEDLKSKLKRNMTSDDEVAMINKSLSSGHLKNRTITAEMIKEKGLAKFYADPIESLEHYVVSMSDTLHKRKFLGKTGSGLDFDNVEALGRSIGSSFKQEMEAGTMNAQDIADATRLIQARFGAGSQSSSALVQGSKNFMYIATLANPLSAVTQAGDAVLSAHINGVANAVLGLAKALTPGGDALRMSDMGIHDIAVDMSKGLKSHVILDKAMRWTGFRKLDEIGKETIINGSIRKNRRRMDTVAGKKRFLEEYGTAFDQPGQLEQVMSDLASGKMTPDIKYMLWNDVTKMQPISMSEMPLAYMESKDIGRFLYSLKTFTVKQLNRMYFDGVRDMTKGNYRKGATQLMGFSGLLAAGGMSTDAIKDAMLGREQMDFDDRFVVNMFKVAGTSDYVVSKLKQGDLEGAVLSTILPPIFPMTADLYKDIAPFDPEKEWAPLMEWNAMNNVPMVGRLLKSHYGGGIEKYNDRMEEND